MEFVNYYIIFVLVIILQGFAVSAYSSMLILVSTPYGNYYCPGRPVSFTCVGTEITSSLFWLVNGSEVADYGHKAGQEYPFVLDIDSPLDEVTAVITDVDGPTNNNLYNITSIFSVSDVTVLDGTSLQCEDSQDASYPLIISLLMGKCASILYDQTSDGFQYRIISSSLFFWQFPLSMGR